MAFDHTLYRFTDDSQVENLAAFQTMTDDEAPYVYQEAGNGNAGGTRFVDGTAYMIYQFDLPDDVTTAFAKVHVGNQFIIEAATGETGEFTVEMDWVAESGEETTDNSNLAVYDIDLTPYLINNPTKVVRLRLSDGVPSNGWGPFLRGIVIQNTAETAEAVFTTVLEAQTLFGEDIRNEHNKRYYTVDLAGVLQNNPEKVFFVKFTDGSTSDGWGPGIFWMAVHTGPITILSDRLVFNDLKTTLGDPETYGAGLLHRRYPLNASKTLSTITLPSQPTTEANQVFLLAATLNAATTPTTVELNATRTAAGNVRLTWPATATGYQLQTRTSLDPGPVWSAVTETPQSIGGEWVLELTPADPTRFYRLAK